MAARTTSADALRQMATSMASCLVHRGPDDGGIWSDATAGVALSFRRLSILDLSAAGHQPMCSASGRFTIIFNGEVYNYLEIRHELARTGRTFRGHSDTEVILAAFEELGIERAVKKFVGMFAIAVWDAENQRLSLIRDRLGIKPLYYYHRHGMFAFGSELKALVTLPGFDRALDPDALSAYLRYLYVPAPHTIYRYARKLLPGHILTLASASTPLPAAVPYWSLGAVYEEGRNNPFSGTDDEAISELRDILSDAVKIRLRSDVPMGALLSGGIDSSTVVALMQANSSQRIRTFSIGFPGTAHDEAQNAARVASALDTDHTEMSVSGEDALAVVPMLADMFDEPFADPSQIPTYLVCKLARRDVTVALTGDGADEVFAGYERYIQGEKIIASLQPIPLAIRRLAAAGIGTLGTRAWERAYSVFAPAFDRGGRHRLAGQKLRKLRELLLQGSATEMYRSLLSAGWQDSHGLGSALGPSDSAVEELLHANAALPLLDRMMLVDQQTYLADDLLAKVDRASMAVSLEARVPLLDHRVLEFAWRLGRGRKVRNGRGKWALRQVLYGMVDPSLVDRPKTGFSVPLGDWLRGPLKGWAEERLFDTATTGNEWLSAKGVRHAWLQVQRGSDDWSLPVWSALMFASWRQRWQG